jgi:hypothetical protein
MRGGRKKTRKQLIPVTRDKESRALVAHTCNPSYSGD